MAVSPKINRIKGYQSLLYYKFIASKVHRIDTSAQKMGISSDTMYKYARGERPFPVDRIPDLVNATGDLEFLEYLTNRCGYSLIPKIKDKHTFKTFAQLVSVMQSAINAKEEE